MRLTMEVRRHAVTDEARPADVIIVLGAAEYRGKPSPVLKARLDHAHGLYQRGLAPLVLTTGGAGGDPIWTEADVGRKYLASRGVPVEDILVESEGESTAESTTAAAEIMRRMNLHTAIVVTDGYHVYRAKRMLESRGVIVYGSPRPAQSPIDPWAQRWQWVRQAVGYGLWSVGIRI